MEVLVNEEGGGGAPVARWGQRYLDASDRYQGVLISYLYDMNYLSLVVLLDGAADRPTVSARESVIFSSCCRRITFHALHLTAGTRSCGTGWISRRVDKTVRASEEEPVGSVSEVWFKVNRLRTCSLSTPFLAQSVLFLVKLALGSDHFFLVLFDGFG